MTFVRSLILGAALVAMTGAANATTVVQDASIGIPELLGADIGLETVAHTQSADDSVSQRHVTWCLSRYRSYNPSTDSFRGYDGLDHRCDGPYN